MCVCVCVFYYELKNIITNTIKTGCFIYMIYKSIIKKKLTNYSKKHYQSIDILSLFQKK